MIGERNVGHRGEPSKDDTGTADGNGLADQLSSLARSLEMQPELIGQAQGILMERFKITGDMAFHMLMLASQDSNRKLRDIADELVATGELPAA